MKSNNHKFLTGILSPISWNNQDEVEGYSLFTADDEDILLRGRNLEGKFEMFKNQRVKISGNFLASFNGARVFEVNRTIPWSDAA